MKEEKKERKRKERKQTYHRPHAKVAVRRVYIRSTYDTCACSQGLAA